MRPLRLLVALSLSWLCAGYSIQRVRSRSLRLKDANNVEQSGSKSSIKLPIVQLIDEKQEMLAEFVCGNDLSLALDKLRATLKTLSGFGPSDICETYVSNVYSDEQLTSLFIHGEKLLILKIYRDGCKKCNYILYEIFMGEAGKINAEQAPPAVQSAFNTMRWIVTIGWAIYPIGYFFGYLTGSSPTASANALNIIYNLADVLNKIAFGLIIWTVAVSASDNQTKA